MNKTEAEYRRRLIREIIVGSSYSYGMVANEWARIVRNNWADGYREAPSVATVKYVCIDLVALGLMDCETITRGWFRQHLFKVVR